MASRSSLADPFSGIRATLAAALLALAACAAHAPPPPQTPPTAAHPAVEAPELRAQLLAMDNADQAARHAWIDSELPPASDAARALAMKVMEIDQRDTAALRSILDAHGWPGIRLVGKDGAHAAWLLAQHADHDLAFQKRCLALLEVAVAHGDAAPNEYAYLYDRVALAEHRLQRYGTQVMGTEPAPLEDPANVDARRAAVGLGPLAEYLKLFRNPPAP